MSTFFVRPLNSLILPPPPAAYLGCSTVNGGDLIAAGGAYYMPPRKNSNKQVFKERGIAKSTRNINLKLITSFTNFF